MRVVFTAKLVVILALASGVLLGGCEQQERRQALDLLRRARAAEQTVSLQGEVQTEISRPEGPVLARAHVQRTPERTVVKFTEGPAAGKEMITEHGQPPRPSQRASSAVSGMEQIPPVETVAQRYDVELGEAATIAGRPVRQVTIQPCKSSSQQAVSLWIDEQTGFPLARERRDAFGHVVYATRYLRVRYEKVPLALPGPTPASPVAERTPAVPSTSPVAPGSPPSPAPASGVTPSAPGQAAPGPSVGKTPPSPQPPSAQPSRPSPTARGRGGGWASLPGGPRIGRRADTGRGHYRPQVVSLVELGQALGFVVTPPAYVPDGFVLRRILLIKQAKPGPRGVLHFSDGVTALTVMVGRRQDLHTQRFPEAAAQPDGAVVVRRPRGTVAVAVRGEAIYIVFGPLPDDSLQRIAASVP